VNLTGVVEAVFVGGGITEVSAGPAEQAFTPALHRVQHVGATATADEVTPCPPNDDIVAPSTDDDVTVAAPHDLVPASVPHDRGGYSMTACDGLAMIRTMAVGDRRDRG
jgi:hypothetical protein